MTDNSNSSQIASVPVIVSSIFSISIAIFSIWVVCNHVAFLRGMSFTSLSVLFTVASIAALPLIHKSYIQDLWRAKKRLNAQDRHILLMLLLLALVGSTISLTAIRPDMDDVNYTSRVIYFLENPGNPLDLKFHDFWILQTEMRSVLKIFQTWSFFCGYFAHLFGLPFLDIYHLILPASGGAAIPLSWFLVFTKFTENQKIAILASLAVCVFLLLNGIPHRSFGNFAFVRIWHSKALVMSLMAPLCLFTTLEFFEKPGFNNWQKMLLLLVACAGLSSMATFFMLFLGILISFSLWFRYQGEFGLYFKTIVAYFTSYSYLVILSVYTFFAIDRTRVSHFGFRGWPDSYMGQFRLVFVDFISYQFICLVVFTIIGIVAVSKGTRKFLISWLLMCLILYLNPVVFPFISKNITTLNTYWRLFYLLPFPLVVGFSTFFLQHCHPEKFSKLFYMSSFILVMIGVSGNLFFPSLSTLSHLRFGLGEYKLDKQSFIDAKQIVSESAPGPMLAPKQYSTVIPILTSKFPQVVVRGNNLMSHAIAKGEVWEAEKRIKAQNYVSGQSNGSLEDVVYFLERGLVNLVFYSGIKARKDWDRLSAILPNKGFEVVAENERYSAYTNTSGIASRNSSTISNRLDSRGQ